MTNKPKSDDQPSLDDLISLKEAADYSGMSASHVRLLVRNGEIQGKKIGRNWVTTRQAVDDYLAKGIKRGPKPND
jgi:excisionase family DNA binding protein